MQTPAEILDGAYSFISLIYAGITLFVFFQTQTNLIRALGDSKTPTILLASGLSLNIIFEPIAILVFDWGIPGAALATLASQVCGNLLCFVFILRKVPALHAHRHDWRPDLKFYWEHLRIALPMGFQSSIIAIGAVILQVALNDLGPLAVAAYAAAQKIESIAMMPMMSFGIAMSAYTAQNYGARKFDASARACANAATCRWPLPCSPARDSSSSGPRSCTSSSAMARSRSSTLATST